MAKIHDKFVIELAEVIKGYGNDPNIDDPFDLSKFYRFYELPEIAVSANHFKTMIPLDVEIAKERKTWRWINGFCSICGKEAVTEWNDCGGERIETNFCPFCGADMRGDGEND